MDAPSNDAADAPVQVEAGNHHIDGPRPSSSTSAPDTLTGPSPTNKPTLVDIGINLTHRALRKHWEDVVQRAVHAGVDTMLLTGTSMRTSRESLKLAQSWCDGRGGGRANLFCTVGVHPHDAKTFVVAAEAPAAGDGTVAAARSTESEMRGLLEDPFAVAVGECGLDYNRNFSPRSDQLRAFRCQVSLACELGLPLFVHEREAHDDLIKVFDEARDDDKSPPLPPVVVHCFTGTLEEARAYLDRGFYIGFTGTICKKERGAHLRAMIPSIPLKKIMIETDAPFMGFIKGKRRHSEPAHVVGVAAEIARVLEIPFEEVCATTTANARHFFRLDRAEPIDS